MTRFHTATHKQLSCELTSEQLLVRAHGPHTHLLVDDVHPSQASWKAEAEVTGQGEKHLKSPTPANSHLYVYVYVKGFHLTVDLNNSKERKRKVLKINRATVFIYAGIACSLITGIT